jgi:hypothetical protein
MRKTALTIFASTLLAGSMVQAATAREHHHIGRAMRAAPVVVGEPFRNAYAYDRSGHATDYSYWASRLEGGAISAPAGH